jgi:hypothetical protein
MLKIPTATYGDVSHRSKSVTGMLSSRRPTRRRRAAALALLCMPLAAAELVAQEASKAYSDRDNGVVQETVLEKIAALSQSDISTLDASTLTVQSTNDSLIATVASRDGDRGFYYSSGRTEQGISVLEPGLYTVDRDGETARIFFNGYFVEPKDPVFPFMSVFVARDSGIVEAESFESHASIGCGGWADPVLASACFKLLVCEHVGICGFPP